MIIASSAPGKIVLLGEYAVLDGAPALVMAVDRRAEVRLQPGTPQDMYTIDAPGIIEKTARFRFLEDGSLAWQGASPEFAERLGPVAQLLRSLARLKMLNRRCWPVFSVTLLTPKFYQSGSQTKLGLGSSAALAVALGSALLECIGLSPDQLGRSRWLRTLLSAHRRMQGNEGSGLDVAASLYGGLIGYRVNAPRRTPEVNPLSLPQSLQYAFLWTGRSASTREFIGAFKSWCRRRPVDADHLIRDLKAISEAGVEAARNDNASTLQEVFAAYGGALRDLGSTSGINIYSNEHQRLQEIATSAGASYKPCGAGGGDFGIAISDDPGVLEQVKKRASTCGFSAPHLELDPRGARTNVE